MAPVGPPGRMKADCPAASQLECHAESFGCAQDELRRGISSSSPWLVLVGVSHAWQGATGNEKADGAYYQGSGAWQSLVPRPALLMAAGAG